MSACTVRPAMNVNSPLFHIFKYNLLTFWCMTIIIEGIIWKFVHSTTGWSTPCDVTLHHYQDMASQRRPLSKHFRERGSSVLVLQPKLNSAVLVNTMTLRLLEIHEVTCTVCDCGEWGLHRSTDGRVTVCLPDYYIMRVTLNSAHWVLVSTMISYGSFYCKVIMYR